MKKYLITESDKIFILKAIEESHSAEIAYDIGEEYPVGVDGLVKHIIESGEQLEGDLENG
jgi:hypothetical protein